MLVLSRKLGEKVIIDGDITITLVGMERGRIRLGFDAPRQVPIVRAELEPLKGSREQLDRERAAKPASRKHPCTHAELLLTL